MPISLIASVATGGTSPVTTGTIDSTGATLLIVAVEDGSSGISDWTISDNKGNTWRKLSLSTGGSGTGGRCMIMYAYDKSGAALSVGPGHAVTITAVGGFPGVFFSAWSGTKTDSTVFDVQNTNNAVSTTVTTGSVTPSVDSALIVSVLGSYTGASCSINSSFTLLSSFAIGAQYSGGFAYQIQTTATTRNPTWTTDASTVIAASIAVFMAAPASSGIKLLSLTGVG